MAGDVDDLTVEERCNRKEAEEAWKIPHQRFSPDLFADVELDVGLQRGPRVSRLPHERNTAEAQHTLEVEVLPELRRHERVHRLCRGAAGEEVRVRGLQSSSA